MASQDAPIAEKEDLDLNGVKLEERPITGEGDAPRRDEVGARNILQGVLPLATGAATDHAVAVRY